MLVKVNIHYNNTCVPQRNTPSIVFEKELSIIPVSQMSHFLIQWKALPQRVFSGLFAKKHK